MKYVVDSGVWIKTALPEPHSDKAILLQDDYRNGIHELLAPDLFPIELSNGLIIAERRGRIAKGEATKLLKQLYQLLPALHPCWPDLVPQAHAIAESTVATTYDCLYVALAVREKCKLVTADDKLYRNLGGQYPIIPLSSLP